MLSIYTPYIIKTMSYLSCNKSVFMLVLVTDAHQRSFSYLSSIEVRNIVKRERYFKILQKPILALT